MIEMSCGKAGTYVRAFCGRPVSEIADTAISTINTMFKYEYGSMKSILGEGLHGCAATR